jgi:uncharacterized protein (DUF433 family)
VPTWRTAGTTLSLISSALADAKTPHSDNIRITDNFMNLIPPFNCFSAKALFGDIADYMNFCRVKAKDSGIHGQDGDSAVGLRQLKADAQSRPAATSDLATFPHRPAFLLEESPYMLFAATDIDWMACELIEQVPGKVSGRPIVRGTRILPDAIVNSFEAGETLEELCEDYPGLSAAQIQRLIEFAHVGRRQTDS